MSASLLPTGREDNRLLAIEQELQSFSYIVSHEMAATLRHLTEFSVLLLADLGEEITDRQQLYAAHMRAAGVNCQAMLEQLLVFSRLQQKALTKVRQDAMPILRLPMLQLAAQAQAVGAEITLAPLGEVYADAELLGLAFSRLMDNAIKFASPGAPPRIAVRPAHDELFWRMRISDNGVGVDSAYREAAFQMFRRLHGQNAYSGVGAGLAICRRIARRHGGEVRFLDCAEGACAELALPHAVYRRPSRALAEEVGA